MLYRVAFIVVVLFSLTCGSAKRGGAQQPPESDRPSIPVLPLKQPTPYSIDGISVGGRASELIERFRPSFYSCLYSKDSAVPICRFQERRLGEVTGFGSPDDISFYEARPYGVVASVKLTRTLAAEESAHSARHSLLAVTSEQWGAPTDTTGRCVAWGNHHNASAAICVDLEERKLWVQIYDLGLLEVANTWARQTIAARSIETSAPLAWWPVWKPYFLGQIRAGMRVEIFRSFLGSPGRARCSLNRGHSGLDPDLTCRWPSPAAVSVAGFTPRLVEASVDTASMRVGSVALYFPAIPERKDAQSIVRKIARELSGQWGKPTDETAGIYEWERAPFRASVMAVCMDECNPDNPWQVYLYLGVYSSGVERDEADVCERRTTALSRWHC